RGAEGGGVRRTPEHEAKLLVGPDYVLPELGDVVPGGTVRLFPDERLEATYFDTRDHRLAGWGVTLRWRVDGGDQGRWTLKLPAGGPGGAGGAELVRSEIEVPGEPGEVPEAVGALVRAYTRFSHLRPVAHLVTVRRRRAAPRDRRRQGVGAPRPARRPPVP